MGNMQSGCQHFWKEDQEELLCFYCGAMLYRNQGEPGPRWLPPVPGEKPEKARGDRSPGQGSRKKKW